MSESQQNVLPNLRGASFLVLTVQTFHVPSFLCLASYNVHASLRANPSESDML